MTWVVVTQAAFENWVTRSDPDNNLRVAVINWLIGLANGPPSTGIFDPFAVSWFAEVGETRVWIEYFVLPDLDPPAIVIREYL